MTNYEVSALQDQLRHIYFILNILKKNHKESAKKFCFSLYASNFQQYAECLNEKYRIIELNEIFFHSKEEFESQYFSFCLKKEILLYSPEVCLKDFENQMYKNLKEFSNIFK